uniref:exonuclease 1-like isoform X2 n=1 Tax=Fragaria vesca subsp. vesca TaxID=101020 RepID=UPI0005C888D9|nr:PREDICTED: exonuclease 1-like isoform X2 [Fragaria vesca subsp. vesca]
MNGLRDPYCLGVGQGARGRNIKPDSIVKFFFFVANHHTSDGEEEEFHDLAREKVEEGNVRAAIELFQRAVSITPSMAHKLIKILRSENVEFVVVKQQKYKKRRHTYTNIHSFYTFPSLVLKL